MRFYFCWIHFLLPLSCWDEQSLFALGCSIIPAQLKTITPCCGTSYFFLLVTQVNLKPASAAIKRLHVYWPINPSGLNLHSDSWLLGSRIITWSKKMNVVWCISKAFKRDGCVMLVMQLTQALWPHPVTTVLFILQFQWFRYNNHVPSTAQMALPVRDHTHPKYITGKISESNIQTEEGIEPFAQCAQTTSM